MRVWVRIGARVGVGARVRVRVRIRLRRQRALRGSRGARAWPFFESMPALECARVYLIWLGFRLGLGIRD